MLQKSDICGMAPWHYHELVFAVTRRIPHGKVTTYGHIADFLALGSARMVGWALNNAFNQPDVPAHRVLNRKGELSGRVHFATPTLMQELLENEGVTVENNRVVPLKNFLWIPADELGEDWEP